MDRNEHRDLMDHVGRDEAALRLQQQESAGDGHRPVHAMPPHGESSTLARGNGAAADLSRDYTQALETERAAWHALLGRLPGEPAFDQFAWDAWRTAVEERDLATRVLINYALGVLQQA
jgi:hypothetical protein